VKLDAAPLSGRFVSLEPFSSALRPEVRAALDVDPDNWAIQFVNGRGEGFDAYWNAACAQIEQGARVAFAVRLADGRVVGTSSFHQISAEHRTVEIGSTFFRPDARGTKVNPEAKLLMMQHAFERGARRVQFTVDSRNERSQAALHKLGALREGVLRNHLITWTGWSRDSVVFSVIAEEWPSVREKLLQRLA
jgi:RimJ/RimL family protein N-acetyltransferase